MQLCTHVFPRLYPRKQQSNANFSNVPLSRLITILEYVLPALGGHSIYASSFSLLILHSQSRQRWSHGSLLICAGGGATPWANPKLTPRDEYLRASEELPIPLTHGGGRWTGGGSRRAGWGSRRNVQRNLPPSCCEATASGNCATVSPYHLVILTLGTELKKKIKKKIVAHFYETSTREAQVRRRHN